MDDSSTTSRVEVRKEEVVINRAVPRAIVIVVLGVAILIVAWLLSSNGTQDSTQLPPTNATSNLPTTQSGGNNSELKLTPITASIVSKDELISATKDLGFPIYWNGKMKDTNLELTILAEGKVFVRYLPNDISAGAAEPYFTVASYYDPAGYARVLNLGSAEGAKFIKYSGGAVAASTSELDSNIYFAFDGNPAVYNVYAPDAQVAWDGLESGTLEILR